MEEREIRRKIIQNLEDYQNEHYLYIDEDSNVETEDKYRTIFQHDIDEIVYSEPFRKLAGKTQLIINPKIPVYRSRLQHSIEVMQIAEHLGHWLNKNWTERRINIDLTVAIALAHDLGHPPFGHSGEKALSKLVPGFCFSHTKMGVWILTLSENVPSGRDLTKWKPPIKIFSQDPKEWKEYKNREQNKLLKFITPYVIDGVFKHKFEWTKNFKESMEAFRKSVPLTLEGQLVHIADTLAYNSSDLEDAETAGLRTWADYDRCVNSVKRKIVRKLAKNCVARTRKQRHKAAMEAIIEYNIPRERAIVSGDVIEIPPELFEALWVIRKRLREPLYEESLIEERDEEAQRIMKNVHTYLTSTDIEHLLKDSLIYQHIHRFIEAYKQGSVENLKDEHGKLKKDKAIYFIATLTDREFIEIYKRYLFPEW